jgi:hypothetical protein
MLHTFSDFEFTFKKIKDLSQKLPGIYIKVSDFISRGSVEIQHSSSPQLTGLEEITFGVLKF